MGLFDRGRGYWPLDDDGAPPIGAPPPAPAERCDRCGGIANFRVGKTMPVLVDTAPGVADFADFTVEVKQLDLLFCRGHQQAYAPALQRQGFVPLQVLR